MLQVSEMSTAVCVSSDTGLLHIVTGTDETHEKACVAQEKACVAQEKACVAQEEELNDVSR